LKQDEQMAETVDEGRLAYSIESLCEKSDTGRTSIYEAIRSGQLRAKKFGARTIILDEDARRFFRGLPDVRAA
jgi:hypothetical protein